MWLQRLIIDLLCFLGLGCDEEEAPRRGLFGALALGGLLAFAFRGCEPLPSTGYTAPISGVVPGEFSLIGGSFQLSVTPLDPAGNPFFDDTAKPEDFTFSDMQVYSFAQPDDLITDAKAVSVDLQVVLPGTTGGGITVPILLDSSGSMSWTDPNDLRKDAAKSFVDQLGNDDLSAVLDFGAGADSGFNVTRLLQDITSDKDLLYAGIDLSEASGGTPLYDSLCETLDWMIAHEPALANPSLLVLTDGEDTASYECTMQSVIEKAQLAEIPVFSVGLGTGIDFTELQELAGQTGGTFAAALDAEDLQTLFESMGVAVTKGRYIVFAQATFEEGSLQNAGQYIIRGLLTVNIKGRIMQTPIEFVIQAS